MLTGTKKDLQQSPIRIGIIGTGFGQAVHIPSFKADPRCSVMAICNARESEGRHIANTHNIQKYFSDWKRLLQDKDIDAVSIAVPPYLQEKIAVEALTLGKPVFCEKPLATSIASAQAIADIATKANLANLIDFEFPEICQWIKAKNYIETSRLGNIYYVCINWHVETYANRNKLSSWKSDPDQGGGILNQFVSHCFYNIEWLLGPIKSLSAIGGKSSQDLRNGDTF
jgi:predicted dehydrogenase